MSWTLGRSVVAMTSVFLTKSCQHIPRIIRWQCIWKASSLRRSSSKSVQASKPCTRIGSMQVWCKRRFVCSRRQICRQTLFSEYMAEEASNADPSEYIWLALTGGGQNRTDSMSLSLCFLSLHFNGHFSK